jgi:hypothetical protein
MTETLALVHPVLVAGAVFLSLFAAAALIGALWVRRRWRRLRLLWRNGPEGALILVGRSAWRWALDRPVPDRRWREVTKSRRQLRLSVAAAERAVDVAGAAGAPVGELRSLSRRLRASADALDASMAIDQWRTTRSAGVPDIAQQVEDLLRAAADIHEAAARMLTGTSGVVQTGLAEDAQRELAAVSAGYPIH